MENATRTKPGDQVVYWKWHWMPMNFPHVPEKNESQWEASFDGVPLWPNHGPLWHQFVASFIFLKN